MRQFQHNFSIVCASDRTDLERRNAWKMWKNECSRNTASHDCRLDTTKSRSSAQRMRKPIAAGTQTTERGWWLPRPLFSFGLLRLSFTFAEASNGLSVGVGQQRWDSLYFAIKRRMTWLSVTRHGLCNNRIVRLDSFAFSTYFRNDTFYYCPSRVSIIL